MKTDKQLLALNKTELVEEYRKLESKVNEVKVEPMSIEQMVKTLKAEGYIVREVSNYKF